MERLMLQILADEVKQGNKPNNVFKTSSLNRVTNAILEKFCVECSLHHVENHLRTVKSYWNVVCTVQGKSGFGWDDNLKMITASPKVYEAYTQAHPTHEKFLNKRIEMYDEMSLVLGKDCATGSFAKSFIDVDLEARSENEVLHVDGDVRSEVSSQPRQHRKRTRDKYDGDASLALISEKLGAMADAITRLTGDRLNVQVLHDEIMAMDGFDELFLGSAFDYLVQHEMLAKAFLAKRDNLRRAWLDNFANKF